MDEFKVNYRVDGVSKSFGWKPRPNFQSAVDLTAELMRIERPDVEYGQTEIKKVLLENGITDITSPDWRYGDGKIVDSRGG